MSFPPTMHSSIDKKGIFSIKTNEYISNSPLQRLKESNDIILAPDGFAKFEISEIEQSIPDRFEKIARQFPENIAVKSKTDCLTYSALNKVANRIAHTILQQSNQGKMVAVLLRQGSDFLAAMLGVLKSGKLYIPMDPSFPQERLNQIITDSQPDTLITTSDYYALAQELVQDDCQLINIDTIASDISVENPKLHISADTLAYIIYTSGSTGRPKGVIQNHRNVLHNCCNNTNSYQIGAADRIILLYSSSVMGAVRAIYYALMNGAALFHVDVKEDGLAELTRTVTQEKITVYHSVTSLFRFFVATLSSVDKFPHLRGIILGGEATLRSDVTLFKKHFPHAMLYLGLGSTEAGGTMRQIVLDQETILHSSTVPLGYPVENMGISILDENGQEVGSGEVGEIAVRSRYISLGYWQRPDLTNAVFQEHPEGDERTYLTGDLGMILPDGCLVHRGRKDFQVKIRGFRVELTEIEMAIRDAGTVGETVVVGQKDAAANMKLIAYVVPKQAKDISRRELRDLLKSKLPDYMVPSFFVMLEALPRTPNGKINRQALPIPDLSQPERITNFVPPRSEIEKVLVQIWSEILGVVQVGINDNFFELGGHSLSATQLVSRVRARLSVRIEPLDLFAAPTIAELDALLLLRQTERLDDLPIVVPTSRQKQMPLSFSQQRLWFLTQLEPESAAYHVSVAYRLNGSLDIVTLDKSLNEIVQRHESLRTVFGQEDGVPYQTILPEMLLQLTQLDLRQTSKDALEDELQKQIAVFNSRPFNLTSGPLLRVGLFHLDMDQYVLAITKHHIISDGSSQGILLQELSRLYAGFVQGDDVSLPVLPVQYADFSVWQQGRLSGQLLTDKLGYWRTKLLGAPPVLQLPTAHPRPRKQTFRGGRELLVLPEQLSQRLNALSRHENATLFMTLLSAFQLLLRRLAGQEDVVVGMPIAGRNQAEIENLIGFFINSLVIRTAVSDNLTFQELLAQVRENALGAYAHQDVPFEKLLEVLKPERDLSRTPIFQVFFNMLNVDLYQLELAGLDVERVSRTDRESKFDLTLYAREENDTIHLRLIYNADLFTAVQMREFLQQYQLLLKQIVLRPHWQIDKYSLVTSTARPFLPDPIRPLPETWPGAVHTLVTQQAQQTPSQTSLTDVHSSWTYDELETRSNQLAHHLRGSGIKSGDVVAIYADRAASLVWAMLGTLKAGAVFLILDPAYPAARLQGYLQVVQPRGWIQLDTAVSPPPDLGKWVQQAALTCHITLPPTPTAALPALETQATTPPAITVNPDDLAYIIFTSGTTGRPKGIRGRHSPLTHFFTWQIKTFALKTEDRFSMLSGLAHDPLLRDIFTPLLAGAALYIPAEEERLQPGQLSRWLAQNEISVTHLTPALAKVAGMGAVGETAVTIPTLRYAFFGGDRLTQQDVHELQTLAANVTCVNFYGTSETPQAMAYHRVLAADMAEETAENMLPIGRGIADVQLLLLNQDQQMAGVNELAEIYIRTPYLAQGYLGDDSLTKERFVVSPWSGNPSDIYYRTGDLGRYTLSGEVMFYGRSDRQVKIRGFRIELAEIELHLNEAEGVAQGVVTALPDSSDQMQLAAYVVMGEERPFSSTDLRAALAAALPSYMIPSAFVELNELPLTPNGKIDYARLPAPDQAALSQQTSYAPPTDALENQLVNIWEAVLKVQPVGIHDNYFGLGGHSLQIIALFAEIEKTFKKRIPLATIFQAPTIAELAAVMRQNGERGSWSSVVPISPAGSKRPFFCVHGGAGHVYHFRGLAQHLEPEQPFYGIQPGNNNGSQPDNDVISMATAYLQEIRQVQPHGPYYLGGFCFGAIVAFEMAQQLTQSGEEVGLVAIIDALNPTYNGQLIPPAAPVRLNVPAEQDAARRRKQTVVAKIIYAGSSVKHVLGAVGTRIQRVRRHLGKFSDKLLSGLYEKLDIPLPHRLHNFQMLAVARNARKQYAPQIYSGDLAVFHRNNVDPQIPAALGWDSLTDQTVHVHKISGKHLELLQEPHVQELARQLQISLDESQR